jgi:outer membrane protein
VKQFAITISLIAVLSSSMSRADDLIEVFERALTSDPQLLAEAASQRAVSELDSQATARFLPQISLSANNGKVRRRSSAMTFGGNNEYNSHGYTLSLIQPIYRPESLIKSTQAEIAIETAQANYMIAEQDFLLRVAEQYFNFLARQDEVGFAVAKKEANTKQLEQVQLRFDLGLATITDLSESQAGLDLANADLILAFNALDNSKEYLRETSGLYWERLAPLQNEIPLVKPEPENIEQWVKAALVNNLSLRVAKKLKEDAEQVISLERSGHLPSLDLVGEKSYTSQSESNFGGSTKVHQDTLSLRFKLPLFEGGNVLSKTREARHRMDQAMQNEEKHRRLVIRQSREAYNGVVSGISRVKALRQALLSGKQALVSTEAGYEVGTRTTVDVLNVRRDFFKAKIDYSSSMYDYILSSLRLKQSAGTLRRNDLVLINQWLEH